MLLTKALILLTFRLSLSLLSKGEDIGNIIVGDQVYLDAGTFLRNDFKKNPSYFVYPTAHQAAFEMNSVPIPGSIVKLPNNCDSAIAAFKNGILFNCKRKLVLYSLVEKEAINQVMISEDTKCGGLYKLKKKRQFFTVCNKPQGLKGSKLYLVKVYYSPGKFFGRIKIFKNPLRTTNLSHRIEFLSEMLIGKKQYAVLWSAPDLSQLGKVTRYMNNRLLRIDSENNEIKEILFDFTGIQEEMTNFSFVHITKIPGGNKRGSDSFLVIIRGFYQSQAYKVDRFQSTLECIWDGTSFVVHRCREIFFDNGTLRLQGNLFSIKARLDPVQIGETHQKMRVQYLYNIPQLSRNIMKKTVAYKAIGYEIGQEFRGELEFIGSGVHKRMNKNQYYPVMMKKGKIFYRDEESKLLRLCIWYSPKLKRTSIRYISSQQTVENLSKNHLCVIAESQFSCYNWSSDAFLQSKTKHISSSYSNFYWYLNHCDNPSCRNPEELEIKAEISKQQAILNPKYKEQYTLDIVGTEGSNIKLVNSRSVVRRAAIDSLVSIESSDQKAPKTLDIFFEKQKEQLFFFLSPNGVEIPIEGGPNTYNIRGFLLDCSEVECTIFRNCMEFDYVEKIHLVCSENVVINEINSKTLNRIYPYTDYLIITLKGQYSGIFVFDILRNYKFVALENMIEDDHNKLSIIFRGFDMYVSSLLTNGQIEVYLISLEKHLQRKIKTLKSRERCSSHLGSSNMKEFVITIYSKCNSKPPKITTFKSANLETFTKSVYYPKASILGEQQLEDICMFKEGVLFITNQKIFFLDGNNQFFTESNIGDDSKEKAKVTCFSPSLIAVQNTQSIRIFDFNNFYRVRFKNSIKFDVPFSFMVTSGDRNFYVTSRKADGNTLFYKLVYYNNDIFGSIKSSGTYHAIVKTELPKDKPVPVTINIRLVDKKSLYSERHPHSIEPVEKIDFSYSQRIELSNILKTTVPYWKIHVEQPVSRSVQSFISNRLLFETIDVGILIMSFDSHQNRIYYTSQAQYKGTNVGYLEYNESTRQYDSNNMINLEGKCDTIKVVEDFDQIGIFVLCRETSQNIIHLIREVNGEYINIYYVVSYSFEKYSVDAIEKNTFLISSYNMYLRTLEMQIVSLEDIDGLHCLSQKHYFKFEGVIQYEIGKIGETYYIISLEEGKIYPRINKVNYYSEDLTLEREIDLNPYLKGTMIMFSCQRRDRNFGKCAFFYAGGEIDLVEFYFDNLGGIKVELRNTLPMFEGIIPRKARYLQNGYLYVYFSKRYNKVGERNDDHRGFYAYKINEDYSFECLGGIGRAEMGLNALDNSRLALGKFMENKIVFMLQNDMIGLIKTENSYLDTMMLTEKTWTEVKSYKIVFSLNKGHIIGKELLFSDIFNPPSISVNIEQDQKATDDALNLKVEEQISERVPVESVEEIKISDVEDEFKLIDTKIRRQQIQIICQLIFKLVLNARCFPPTIWAYIMVSKPWYYTGFVEVVFAFQSDHLVPDFKLIYANSACIPPILLKSEQILQSFKLCNISTSSCKFVPAFKKPIPVQAHIEVQRPYQLKIIKNTMQRGQTTHPNQSIPRD